MGPDGIILKKQRNYINRMARMNRMSDSKGFEGDRLLCKVDRDTKGRSKSSLSPFLTPRDDVKVACPPF